MEPTLDEAIQSVFGTTVQPQLSAQAPGAQPELGQASAQFDDAQKAVEQGNWADFGKSMDALKRLLNAPVPTGVLGEAAFADLKTLPRSSPPSGVP